MSELYKTVTREQVRSAFLRLILQGSIASAETLFRETDARSRLAKFFFSEVASAEELTMTPPNEGRSELSAEELAETIRKIVGDIVARVANQRSVSDLVTSLLLEIHEEALSDVSELKLFESAACNAVIGAIESEITSGNGYHDLPGELSELPSFAEIFLAAGGKESDNATPETVLSYIERLVTLSVG
ncbi:MAG: hypothetical protein LBP86_03195 [Azoarcus sp.]|jgi:hypothetical protein|nr:hypothetical protein [Azoarcus sp.]